jgi:hypothetical protein
MPPSMCVMTANVLIAGNPARDFRGADAPGSAMASKRPTAQALLPPSTSAISSIISLLLVMLWA